MESLKKTDRTVSLGLIKPRGISAVSAAKNFAHFLPCVCMLILAGLWLWSVAGCSGGNSSDSSAPGLSWSQAGNGLPGALVLDLAADPSDFNHMFAATQEGLYRTADGGTSWSAVTSGNVILPADCVIIAPGAPATLYAAKSGTGVFKSTDDGFTWTTANNGLTDNTIRVLVIDPTSPETIYIGTDTAIFRSVDGANSWSALDLPVADPEIDAIAIDGSDPDTIYAGTNGAGILKSTDGGLSWSVLTSGLANLYVHAIAIDPSNSDVLYAGTCHDEVNYHYIYKSTDGGASWAAASIWGTECVGSLVIDPVTPSTLYAGETTFGGFLKSNDGGVTWDGCDNGLPWNFKCNAIVINPAKTSMVYAGGYGDMTSGIVNMAAENGVYFSENAGHAWSPRNDGMTNVAVEALLVNPTDSKRLYAATERQYLGFHCSTDGGTTWRGRSGLDSAYTINALSADPVDPSIIYAAGTGRYETLHLVNDCELSALGNDDVVVYARVFVVELIENQVTFFIGTSSDGVFKSIDYGDSWTAVNTGLTNLSVTALIAHSDTPTTLYAGTQGGVYKTTNGGASWLQASRGLGASVINALAIDPEDPSNLYAGTEQGVYRSMNAASSWSVSNTGLTSLIIHTLAVDPERPAIIYAGTADGLFRSLSFGANWQAENEGLYVRDIRAIAIDPMTPRTIYVGTSNAGIFKAE